MGSVSSTDLSADFARTCTTAAFGYAQATTAAYAALAQQAMSFWSDATRRVDAKEKPLSFSITRPGRSVASPASESTVNLFDPFGLSKPWLALEREARANMKAWWGLYPFAGNPAGWPMAFQMMKSGVPRDVALPAAEANVAAFEAARIAQNAVAKIFSAYQTDGGHASVHFAPSSFTPNLQPIFPKKSAEAAFNPANLMWPWLSAPRTFM